MRDQLVEIFELANEEFLVREESNILNGVAERNLCSRLALYLNDRIRVSEFSAYHVDTEYNRKQDGKIKTIIDDDLEIVKITCDCIIHSRGEIVAQDNLLAIEMKKSTAPDDEKTKDRIRLRALTKQTYDDTFSFDGTTIPEHVCGYIIGVYLELDIAARTVLLEYYESGEITSIDHLTF